LPVPRTLTARLSPLSMRWLTKANFQGRRMKWVGGI
jgi:hypothetical protein